MKQVVQSISGGAVRVIDVPAPAVGPTDVLVRTLASVISPGTERAVTELARASLLEKARGRPDLVRKVLRKATTDGLRATARSVRDRLDEDVPLGYSASGIVMEVGEAVSGVSPGALVATAGGGRANHAELQSVPGLLCVPVPDGVEATDAAFATIGAIALHGLRLAEIDAGSRVLVIGLGLVGQLAMRLTAAMGCEPFGIDVNPTRVTSASQGPGLSRLDDGDDTTRAVMQWSRGRGADAIVIAAASPDPAVLRAVPARCRDRATVVVVGDVAVDVDRRPFYEKELTVRFARSYGPGRYEMAYERWGVDYPAGQLRWTEGRNLEAILDLLASRRLEVSDLITHTFAITDAPKAYELVSHGADSALGVQLRYPDVSPTDKVVPLRAPPSRAGRHPGVGLIGAGAFARTILVPALRKAGFERWTAVASASGLSAVNLGERLGFERAVPDADAVIADPDVDVVVVATTHASHATLVTKALRAGKHVYCEKPLALTQGELDDVEAAMADGGAVLFVGFNRRWSDAVRAVQDHFGSTTGPLVITYRVSAGTVEQDHWYADRREGGRLLGEVSHFVDTCLAFVGGVPTQVTATAGAIDGEEALLTDHLAVTLGWPDGSVAAITYGTRGHPRTEKERIEVLGRGRSAVIEDFRQLRLDGRSARVPHGKGHEAEAVAFRRALDTGDVEPGRSALASSRVTLLAAASLLEGRAG
jgi:predicted dehydrogenase/threonine dehydrogenase-like Zn-dependent dehydrogenase